MNFEVVDEHGRRLGMAQPAVLISSARGAGRSGPPGARRPEARPVAAGYGAGGTACPARARRAAGWRHGPPHLEPAAATTYTAWTFGELPELMEITRAAASS